MNANKNMLFNRRGRGRWNECTCDSGFFVCDVRRSHHFRNMCCGVVRGLPHKLRILGSRRRDAPKATCKSHTNLELRDDRQMWYYCLKCFIKLLNTHKRKRQPGRSQLYNVNAFVASVVPTRFAHSLSLYLARSGLWCMV